jgi:hypothetical protein
MSSVNTKIQQIQDKLDFVQKNSNKFKITQNAHIKM